MAVPGIRNVADARQRLMANTASQAAWTTLDCGFGVVADVFDDCFAAAQNSLSATALQDFLEAARMIGKLGRGPDPLLAFLATWPDLARHTTFSSERTLPALMGAVRSLQKSPNAPAVTPLLETLGAVCERLRTPDALADYFALVVDHATRTAGSILGRQITHPSPSLPDFLMQMPRLLSVLSLAGLRRWMEEGIRLYPNYADHPEQQRAYFSLAAPESLAILQREREGTLFADVERKLTSTLQALWQNDLPLIPYSTAFSEHRLQPYLAADGLRLPDVLDDLPPLSGLQRYRAILAHLAGHQRWSQPLVADNWSPLQRMAVECLEDARIDWLLIRRFPGLRPVLLALHPIPVEDACDLSQENGLRHRLTCLSRACLDPAHPYRDPILLDTVRQFQTHLADGDSDTLSSTQQMADLALRYAARSRLPSDQFAKVRFADTEVDYRDDNRHLWRFIEAGDEEESFDSAPRQTDEEPQGLPPRRYPEWDHRTQTDRPDWTAVYEALHPAGAASEIDQLLAKHAPLARQLKRLLDLLKPQDRVRQRFQENGSELDLDVAVRAWVDWQSGHLPDPRIQVSHRTDGRDISVLLLLDLSQSLNNSLPGSQQTILQTAREAVALLAWAVDQLGDACAIAGFHSNTRHEVRYHHIKGFSEPWGDPVKARLAAVEAGWSTRMGAALRHASKLLSARRTEKRILLVLTDGEPADIDVTDPEYLHADTKKAVDELSALGITPFCLSLDPKADEYVSHIFGKHWRVLDRVERLPEQLPMVYLGLTRG